MATGLQNREVLHRTNPSRHQDSVRQNPAEVEEAWKALNRATNSIRLQDRVRRD